jgi:3-oxoacyl-[acyl-carrier-protein] synthase III
MNSYIQSISYYLPEKELTNEIINKEFPEWSIEKISSKTGIKNRHIAADDEFASDMAFKAATKLLEEYSVNRESIDFVILCTQSPDYFLPTSACILQDRLKLSTSCGAFDFNLGCSGFIYGLAIAKGLIDSGTASNILFITSETYSKHLHMKDKVNRTLFGDAAAATLISTNPSTNEGKILKTVYGTDGSGHQHLIVKTGGMRFSRNDNEDVVDEFGNIKNDNCLFMDGREIFSFTIKIVPDIIRRVLEKNQLKIEDIDLFIFHQANKFMLDHLRKSLKIPEEKFFLFLEGCGNTVSSTIPIALLEARKQTKCQPGSKVMLVGFGVGLSWGATIIEY